MRSDHEVIPADSLSHLAPALVAAEWELAAIARLQAAGFRWRGLAVPATFEERFYRLNSLPHQLLALYKGLDPADPDEDILEEAEPDAVRLVGQHYLLEESVDLLYDSLAWSGPTTVRRPGSHGEAVSGRRAVLLAIKRLYQRDWTADAVIERLARTATLGIDARPVLVTPAPERRDAETARRAGAALGEAVEAWVGPDGALVRLAPA